MPEKLEPLQSIGLMLNLVYDLARVSQNQEGFATSHAVAASFEIRTPSAAAEKAKV